MLVVHKVMILYVDDRTSNLIKINVQQKLSEYEKKLDDCNSCLYEYTCCFFLLPILMNLGDGFVAHDSIQCPNLLFIGRKNKQ